MKIRSQSKLRVAWVFAILWNLIAAPATFLGAVLEIERGRTIAWVALIFPFAGAGLLIWAIHLTLRWWRFGASWLEMAGDGAVLGGELRGRIAASRLPDDSTVVLTLTCVNRLTRGSGRNRSVSEKVLWQDEQTVARERLEPAPEGVAVPVSFDLPADAPPTRGEPRDDRILWRLQARASIPGVDYLEQFEVPIAEPPPGQRPASDREDARSAGPPARPGTSRIVVEPGPEGGARFVLPAGRNLHATLVSVFFACLFCGGAALFMLLARSQAGGAFFGFVPWVFAIVLVPFALLTVVIALHTGCLGTAATATPAGLVLEQRLFGLSWARRLPRTEIAGIRLHVGMQVGMTPYYDLKIALVAKRSVTLSSMLRDRREAEWLAAEIRKALG